MQATKRPSISVWMQTEPALSFSALTHDETADVCIVGAGIAGMSCAYMLARHGKKVIVLDDGPIGSGQTQRTTAHLSNEIDDRYFEIERLHGEEGATICAQSHTAAIERIETTVRDEAIDCDFERVPGYLFLGPGQEAELLAREHAAAHRAGLTEVEELDKAPVDFFDSGPCLRFPRQAQFHPLKYLAGLAGAVRRDGGQIFTGTHVQSVEGGDRARISVEGGHTVTAHAAIVATNTPINDRMAIHTKQAPYLSYVIGASVPKGSVPRALFWDTEDPYHYVRIQPAGQAGDVLIVGGEDHKTGQADDGNDRYARLESWARERFPMLGGIAFRWSGQVMEPVDGVAFIGRNPGKENNVFIATGDSGMGMTHGTIAGMLLYDLILGRINPWAKLYDPSRKSVKSLGEFASENLNVARQYGDWLTGGDVHSADDIKPGSGAVVRRGLHKLAIYRDEEGQLHEHSAACPHLGCVVQWNDPEKTWDCPCHGSRFDQYGTVLNGPANTNLSAVQSKAAAHR
jgi:glycine/D-amino acid oxidase-like deaminating enzyme/nitrite reductase/ring-hydroxylating ferredoxin subunit